MKSIQTKLTLVTACTLTILMIVSSTFSIIAIRNNGYRSTHQMLDNKCEAGADSLDVYFDSVGSSVETVAEYAESDLDGLSSDELAAHMERVRDVFSDITYVANGVTTYYYRVDPAVTKEVEGFWYTNLEGKWFREHKVTDISRYDTSDTSQLVWFTVPKATGEAVWLPPYVTDNLGVRVISYNVPIYWNDKFFGVIGIEIDYSTMTEQVNKVSLYDSGYAFLADDDVELVYHPKMDVTTMDNPPDVPDGLRGDSKFLEYTYDGVKKQATWNSLENGMRLYVTVPKSEINSEWMRSIRTVIVGSLILLAAVILMSLYIVRILHRNEETRAAQFRLEKELESVTQVTELMGSMSSLLTNMPAMSFSKDAETGVYLACNQEFAQYAGKNEPSEVVGNTDHDLFDKDTADHFVEDDRKALSMDDAYVFFEDVPDAFGRVVRYLQTTKKKYRDSGGRLCLLGMCVDVTATTKAKAEEAAKQAREEEAQEKEAMEASYRKDVERLSYQASHDELTDLYNRFGYDFIISEVDLSRVYLLMVDSDDFKVINDKYGHEIGDKVLVKIAELLKKNFGPDEYIGRLGGDEFVVVMTDTEPDKRELIKSRIDSINEGLADTSDGLPPTSISVGISYGSEASDAIELLKLADLAMYDLKRSGKRGYRFSDEIQDKTIM